MRLLVFKKLLYNYLLLSGGFALLATTGANLAGLGGPAAAAVGAATLTGASPVFTGLMPLAAAGAVGILGGSFKYLIILCDVGFCQEYLPCSVSAP